MVPHRLADLSRALFHNSYLLPVAATILSFSDARFTRRQIAARLGVADNLVTKPVARLREANLIKPNGLIDVEGEHFDVTPGPFWDFVRALSTGDGDAVDAI